LTLPAQLDSLETIGRYVMTVSEEAGVSRKRAYKLRLAVDESVSNIIIHGCANSSSEAILEISAQIDPESLKITVIDNGTPYDPRERDFDQSILSQPIEERPMGGLGIFLSLQNVDEFSYQVDGQKNISSFLLKREPTDTP
jgi:serine/threonine-protein kinase RsbW